MKVDVEDILSRISGRVEDDAVSPVLDSLFSGDLPRFEQDVSDEVFFLFGDVIQGREMFLGNEQDMNGGLRVYVVESKDRVVFINGFCRDLLVYDFAKYTVIHFPSPQLNYS
jgi:hypothetical protein